MSKEDFDKAEIAMINKTFRDIRGKMSTIEADERRRMGDHKRMSKDKEGFGLASGTMDTKLSVKNFSIVEALRYRHDKSGMQTSPYQRKVMTNIFAKFGLGPNGRKTLGEIEAEREAAIEYENTKIQFANAKRILRLEEQQAKINKEIEAIMKQSRELDRRVADDKAMVKLKELQEAAALETEREALEVAAEQKAKQDLKWKAKREAKKREEKEYLALLREAHTLGIRTEPGEEREALELAIRIAKNPPPVLESIDEILDDTAAAIQTGPVFDLNKQTIKKLLGIAETLEIVIPPTVTKKADIIAIIEDA